MSRLERAQTKISSGGSTVEKTATEKQKKLHSKYLYIMKLIFHLFITMLKGQNMQGSEPDSFILYIDFMFKFKGKSLCFLISPLSGRKITFSSFVSRAIFLVRFYTLFQK